jgi:hypothetical protein
MSLVRIAATAALCTLCAINAHAHAIVGDRAFPATLAIDDPGVADELALPTFTYTVNPNGSYETDLSASWTKRITENFAASVTSTYAHVNPGGWGWENLSTGLKYQAFTDLEHEFMVSVGAVADLGATGAARVGAAPFTTITPNVYFGKGLGDLPTSMNWLRPAAITGQFGLAIPTAAQTATPSLGPGFQNNPTYFNWGFTVQYSLPYLNAQVGAIDNDFLRKLVPLVEFAFQTPVANGAGFGTTGTINPSVVYSEQAWQIAVEAVIPVNSASGRNVGVIAELHFFLDDLFPNSVGKPLIP